MVDRWPIPDAPLRTELGHGAGYAPPRRLSSLTLTIGVHALALVGLFVTFHTSITPAETAQPLVVQLEALASPPEPVRELEPGPERVEQEPRPPAEPRPPTVVPTPLGTEPTPPRTETREEPSPQVEPVQSSQTTAPQKNLICIKGNLGGWKEIK